MTVRSYPGGRAQSVDQRGLTRNLESLALKVEEALGELWLGAGSGDVGLECAAARRIASLGFLMGEDVRRYERGSGSGRRAAAASAPPTATRRP